MTNRYQTCKKCLPHWGELGACKSHSGVWDLDHVNVVRWIQIGLFILWKKVWPR